MFEKQNLSINPSNIFIIFHNSRAGVLAELEQCARTNITASPHNIVSFSSLQNHKIALLLVSGSNGNTQMKFSNCSYLNVTKNGDFVLVRRVKK